MNDLERLKQAEEAGPMAVYVLSEWPKGCLGCDLSQGGEFLGDEYCGITKNPLNDWDKRNDDCPLRPAIGIIEPGGHVAYLREGEE